MSPPTRSSLPLLLVLLLFSLTAAKRGGKHRYYRPHVLKGPSGGSPSLPTPSPSTQPAPRPPPEQLLPHKAPQPGHYDYVAGPVHCARSLDMQFVGASGLIAKVWLDSTACTAGGTTGLLFSPVPEPAREIGRLSAHTALASVLRSRLGMAPLSCGTRSLPPRDALLYVASEDHTSAIGFTKALLTLRRMALNINELSASARQPGCYVQSSTGCVWRRVADLDDEQELSPEPSSEVGGVNAGQQAGLALLTNADARHNGEVHEGEEKKKDNNCFPADAAVVLRSGEPVPISWLRTGDAVLTGRGRVSRVVAWTHREADGLRPFVKVSTTDARISLTASHGHYVYVNGTELRTMDRVRVGDVLEVGLGAAAHVSTADTDGVYVSLPRPRRVSVTRVEEVLRKGLYNPQTGDGDIVVDGVRCSTYTNVVPPVTAHALLTPVRAAVRLVWTAAVRLGHGRWSVREEL